ncbi:hypothetical protein [Streptomyces parvulus]|uniref:hypothetical protein n=1 Tax=Streptomyces parvulus TaxID=146923 RepID=UPI0036920D69
MTDHPYTDDDLRAEAARQHATLTEDPDFMGVGEMMQDAEVESLAPQHASADVDGQPTDADCATWSQLLPPEADDCEAYDLAQNQIYDLIRGAADVSEWAVNLGADGLVPSDAHQLTLDGDDKPIARIHFAFEPDMPEEMKNALVTGLARAIADAL